MYKLSKIRQAINEKEIIIVFCIWKILLVKNSQKWFTNRFG